MIINFAIINLSSAYIKKSIIINFHISFFLTLLTSIISY